MVYIYAFLGRLLLYPYLMYRSSRLLPGRASWLIHRYLLIELALSTLALLLHSWVMHPAMSLAVTVGLFIFFSTGYAAALLLGVDVVRHVLRRLRPAAAPLSPGMTRALSAALVAAVTMVFVGTMVVGYRQVVQPRMVFRELSVEVNPAMGDALRPMRLALITDLHIGEGITPGLVARVVDSILAVRPDVVLVGGDYIDHYSRYAYVPAVMERMRHLARSVPEGVYYVPGNHEWRADSLAKLSWVSEVGGVLLLDSIVSLRQGLVTLIGRDDFVHRATRTPLSVLGARARQLNAPLTILLEHTPEELDSLSGLGIDLALYGHTHGGQLFPNHLATWLRYGVTSGAYRRGDTEIYVSSGVGSAGAPYRIGTRSEIVVYDLRFRPRAAAANVSSTN